MTYQLLPFALLRELDNSGKLLSGGKIYTYQAGTFNPKQTFQTAAGSVAHSNPIILSASGTANIFLDLGTYDLVIKTANDELIGTVEGVLGSSGNVASENVNQLPTINCKLYEDVRNLISQYGIINVSGRSTVGDGGEGTFERVSGQLESDDDGYILISQNGDRYRRITNTLDPRYYGAVYQSVVDQFESLAKATQSSAKYNLPLIIEDSLYLTTALHFTGQTIFTLGGKLTSNGIAAVQFDKVNPSTACFKSVNIILSDSMPVYVSWFDDFNPLESAYNSISNGRVIVDIPLTILNQSLIIPDSIQLMPLSIITLDASIGSLNSLSITCKNLYNPEYKQIFSISNNWSFFGIMDFGKRFMAPEEFGFTKYASTIIPLLSGNVLLNQAREYTDSITASTQSFTVSNLNIKGVNRNSVINIYPNISGTNFNASNCGIKIPGEVSYTNAIFNNVLHYDFEATYTNLIANNCSLPFSKLIITNSNLSQTVNINGDQDYNWYVGKPTFIEPYINDIKNKAILSTDADGKVYGTSISNYGNMVVDANGIITGTLKPYIRSRVVTVPHSVNVDIVGQVNNFNFFFTQLPIQHNSIIQIGDTLSIVERNAAHGNITLRLGIYERTGDVMTCLALTDAWNTVQSTPYVYWTKAITSIHTKVTMESDKRYYVGVYQYDTVDASTSSLGMLNNLVNGIEQACKGIAAQSPYTGQNITVTAYSAYIHHEYTPVN